jgi:hypothetical protein
MSNEKCPPYIYLCQVAEHCSKAMSTFLLIWREMDDDYKLKLYHEDITDSLLFSLHKFHSDLKLLCKEGLLSYREDKKKKIIKIDITGYENDAPICK